MASNSNTPIWPENLALAGGKSRPLPIDRRYRRAAATIYVRIPPFSGETFLRYAQNICLQMQFYAPQSGRFCKLRELRIEFTEDCLENRIYAPFDTLMARGVSRGKASRVTPVDPTISVSSPI